MSSGKGVAEFPNVEAKLQKPTKQSAFEKQKAEAVAKRQREEAETAAVLKDFVESFDRDEDGEYNHRDGGGNAPGSRFGQHGRPPFGAPPPGGPSRRHFGASGLKSGPGSLGPPPPSFGKKRSFQDFSRGPREKTMLGFEDEGGNGSRGGAPLAVSRGFDASDDEDMGDTSDRAEERAIAKPTLRLSQLPPGTSPAVIKALMPENLTVENVKIVPQVAHGAGSERRSTVAIVTLSQETPANEIDATVSSLQNRYLGYGYYMSLHRHLSSAVSGTVAAPGPGFSTSDSHPFGAKPVEQPSDPNTRPPPHQGFHRGFAPPTTYSQPLGGVSRAGLLHVPVKPPQDIKTVQLINKVIERVLEHGPEFEALLMSRPEVQREEKWAWIWDARSTGGIWFRWRLWEVVTGSDSRKTKGKFVPLFDSGHAWKTPEKSLPFEYSTKLDEFISDSDYNSSDDEELDGDGNREGQGTEVEKSFLNPLEKSKLTHLLARLPTTLSRLRKGDIARVTTFAIMHASRGVDEVVDIITSNVEKPFSLTAANPVKRQEGRDAHPGDGAEETAPSESVDISAASLVGLYVVSDILSSSSTSGVRHAWRFRQLFEAVMRDRKTFECLGMMAEKHGWGRLRAEKWKRSVGLVLNLWEGWCVFPAEGQELFVNSFENPPSLKIEDKAEESTKKGRWKIVEASLDGSGGDIAHQDRELPMVDEDDQSDVGGEPIEDDDVVGEPIDENSIDGEPIDEDDVEGEPIVEDDIEGEPMDEDDIAVEPEAPAVEASKDTEANGKQDEPDRAQPRKRMRAVDMFADSDDSDRGG